ncbi:hypothetical protein [Deinococcus roseus]|uniref:VP17 central beta-barrel domain-containing protein n=1 Tax=Deinococcus roseus TaxID=392414 RepID=A0ABQ2DGB4_9DEIO|nr:hypothetical protein [Deinococcus roseus]GGJ56585.1 hypothetical protein GCM10008938_48430 [Deinococcus roseus]
MFPNLLNIALALGASRSTVFTQPDFKVGTQQTGILSPIAYLEVPKGHLYALKGQIPFTMYIMAKYEFAIATDSDVVHTVELAPQGGAFSKSTRPAPTLPAQNHPDIRAYISSNGGTTWTQTNVLNIDYDDESVNITKLAGTNRIKVYYLTSKGTLTISAQRPAGSDAIGLKIFDAPLRKLHEVDQTNIRSAVVLGSRDVFILPEDWRLFINVKSPVPIEWSVEAGHELALNAFTQPIKVLDAQALNAKAEEILRGGF